MPLMTLPPGWTAYATLDAEKAREHGETPNGGARREDGRAFVFAVGPCPGREPHLRAEVVGLPARSFQADALHEAARWCDEQL